MTTEVKVIEQDQVATSSPITPMEMINTALSNGASMDSLEKLMDLQERWQANEAKKAFVKSMNAFRSEVPAIKKTRKAHNSMYAGLSDTIDIIRPYLVKNGLSHAWSTNHPGGAIEVTCTVTHIDGHSESTTISAEADTGAGRNKIQAVGSTITYLQRYTLFSILGLASTDQDDDGASAEGLTLEQVLATIEAAKSVADLDKAAKLAQKLGSDDKAKARDAYKLRKEELDGNH